MGIYETKSLDETIMDSSSTKTQDLLLLLPPLVFLRTSVLAGSNNIAR